MRKSNSSYISTVIGITLVLFFLGLLSFVVLQAQRLERMARENISIDIYLHKHVDEMNILAFQKGLDIKDFTKSTRYISQQEAQTEYEESLGESYIQYHDFVLPASIQLYLEETHTTPEEVRKLVGQIQQDGRVQEVIYREDRVVAMNEQAQKAEFWISLLSGLLLVVSVALINNTIRLDIYSKRTLIKSMQLIGATERFIRKPFIFKSIIQGVLGALIGFVSLLGILILIIQKYPEDLSILADNTIFVQVAVIMLVFGLIITWLATRIAVSKYLKLDARHVF